MNAKVVIAVMGVWLMGLLVSPLAMAVELDFNIGAPTSGTISYAGGGGALIGSNIEVDNVVGLSTPANAMVWRPAAEEDRVTSRLLRQIWPMES
jgi:hypothetical protein